MRLIWKWQDFWNQPLYPETFWLTQLYEQTQPPSPGRKRIENLYLLLILSCSRCIRKQREESLIPLMLRRAAPWLRASLFLLGMSYEEVIIKMTSPFIKSLLWLWFNLAEKHMSCSKLNISNCSYLEAALTLKFGTNYEANQWGKCPFFSGTNSQMTGNIALSQKYVTQACLFALRGYCFSACQSLSAAEQKILLQ